MTTKKQSKQPLNISRWNDAEVSLRKDLLSALEEAQDHSTLRPVILQQISRLVQAVHAVKRARKFARGGKVPADVVADYAQQASGDLIALEAEREHALDDDAYGLVAELNDQQRQILEAGMMLEHVSQKDMARVHLGQCMGKLKKVHKELFKDLQEIEDEQEFALLEALRLYMDHVAKRTKGRSTAYVMEDIRVESAVEKFEKPSVVCIKEERRRKARLQRSCMGGKGYDRRFDPCASDDPELSSVMVALHGRDERNADMQANDDEHLSDYHQRVYEEWEEHLLAVNA